MKPIFELEKNIDILVNEKDSILEHWVQFDEVKEILQKHKIEQQHFVEVFASAIFDYFSGVVKREKEIGDCPVMAKFLDYLKEHDVSTAELFII